MDEIKREFERLYGKTEKSPFMKAMDLVEDENYLRILGKEAYDAMDAYQEPANPKDLPDDEWNNYVDLAEMRDNSWGFGFLFNLKFPNFGETDGEGSELYDLERSDKDAYILHIVLHHQHRKHELKPPLTPYQRMSRNYIGFGLLMTFISWAVALYYQYPPMDTTMRASSELGLSISTPIWNDIAGGAFFPALMIIARGWAIGWLIIFTTLTSYLVWTFSKKTAIFMQVSMGLISNFINFGLLIKPLFIAASVVAPLMFMMMLGGALFLVVKDVIRGFIMHMMGND